MNRLLLTFTAVAALSSSLTGTILPLNLGLGSNTERGIVFDLINTSTTETVVLTGEFNLPITMTTSVDFSLFARNGTVVGNVGPGATNWSALGNAVATGQGYASPTFTLTPFTFSGATGTTIAPGQTLGIFLKNTSNSGSPALRYVNGGLGIISTTVGFTNGGLTYDGDRGLGATGLLPTETNNFFGPTRNFVGEIGYSVVPEPATCALVVGLLAAVMIRRRIRR